MHLDAWITVKLHYLYYYQMYYYQSPVESCMIYFSLGAVLYNDNIL